MLVEIGKYPTREKQNKISEQSSNTGLGDVRSVRNNAFGKGIAQILPVYFLIARYSENSFVTMNDSEID